MATLKANLRAGRLSRGMWITSGSHVVAELAGGAGFDWCLLDREHGLGSEDDTLRQIQALGATPAGPIVRVPVAAAHLIKRYLDFGAVGIMAPMVRDAAEAEAFVAALRYPPRGVRGMASSCRAAGFGSNFDRYFRDADETILGIVQIETPSAVADCRRIAAVDGVDVLFVGHSDLSLQLGCFGEFDSPAMLDAEQAVLSACREHGKAAGMLCRSSLTPSQCAAKGFTFLALSTDTGCLKSSFSRLLQPPE